MNDVSIPANRTKEFMIAEYNTLRTEVLQLYADNARLVYTSALVLIGAFIANKFESDIASTIPIAMGSIVIYLC
ncbi:MAG: hypothetical protein AAF637_18000, partial [Pseudomonadota bacterium]